MTFDGTCLRQRWQTWLRRQWARRAWLVTRLHMHHEGVVCAMRKPPGESRILTICNVSPYAFLLQLRTSFDSTFLEHYIFPSLNIKFPFHLFPSTLSVYVFFFFSFFWCRADTQALADKGHWNVNHAVKAYMFQLDPKVTAIMAEATDEKSYSLPRDRVEVPKHLQKKIFPDLDDVMAKVTKVTYLKLFMLCFAILVLFHYIHIGMYFFSSILVVNKT